MNKNKILIGAILALIISIFASTSAYAVSQPVTYTKYTAKIIGVIMPDANSVGGVVTYEIIPAVAMGRTVSDDSPVYQPITLSLNNILVIDTNDDIIPSSRLLSQGSKIVVYTRDNQPYMVKVIGSYVNSSDTSTGTTQRSLPNNTSVNSETTSNGVQSGTSNSSVGSNTTQEKNNASSATTNTETVTDKEEGVTSRTSVTETTPVPGTVSVSFWQSIANFFKGK